MPRSMSRYLLMPGPRSNHPRVPLGIMAIQKIARSCCPQVQVNRELLYKANTLILTFICYTFYHMSRKPISVVKSVLHHNCTLPNDTTDCGYPPFDTPDAKRYFGLLDSAFLFAYAIFMFVSGFIAERVSLRWYLAIGMALSGIFVCLFGLAKAWNIHYLSYFVIVQLLCGVVQTTGWPGVVTLMARWFGKGKRGMIFGLWNSHTSVGNILGTLIAAYYVEGDWALSFVVPGVIIIAGAVMMLLFAIDEPSLVGLHNPEYQPVPGHTRESPLRHDDADVSHRVTERTPILEQVSPEVTTRTSSRSNAISPLRALAIPGVVEFAFCLFFTKLVSYTFLFWLPFYIMQSTTLSPERAADLSTLFDVGGILGGIVAGIVCDYSGMPAFTCAIMLFFAGPVLYIYQLYGTVTMFINISLLIMGGFLVNGPYGLITTAVCAALGQHRSLAGNAQALATVTAIIDGTGSIGAAVGPLFAGLVSSTGWENVFYMLIASIVCALLFLTRLVIQEFMKRRRQLPRTRIE